MKHRRISILTNLLLAIGLLSLPTGRCTADELTSLADAALQAIDTFEPPQAAKLEAIEADLRYTAYNLASHWSQPAKFDSAVLALLYGGELMAEIDPEFRAAVAQLAEGNFDEETVATAYSGSQKMQEGLGLSLVATVRVNAWRWLMARRMLNGYNADTPRDECPVYERYKKASTLLAESLRAYETEPLPKTFGQIEDSLLVIESTSSSTELIKRVRRHFFRSGLYIAASERMFSALLATPIQTVEPVRQQVDGATIVGQGVTSILPSVDCIADPNTARVDLRLGGTMSIRARAMKGPATIYTRIGTEFSAVKPFWLDGSGIRTSSASCRANCRMKIDGARTRSGSRLMGEVVKNAATKRKSQMQRDTARRTAQSVVQRIDRQIDDFLCKAQTADRTKTGEPAVLPALRTMPGRMGQSVAYSTTERHLKIRTWEMESRCLGPAKRPPVVAEAAQGDLVLRIHQSTLNRALSHFASGREITRKWVCDKIVELQGELPEWLAAENEVTAPWTMTLDNGLPISVRFDNDRIDLAVRMTRIEQEKSVPGMVVRAGYEIATSNSGFKLVRDGEVVSEPLSGGSGGSSSVILQTVMRRRLARMFEEEFSGFDSFPLPKPSLSGLGSATPAQPNGKIETAGNLQLVRLTTKDGWLTAVWRYRAKK